jgi:hypothetical protein
MRSSYIDGYNSVVKVAGLEKTAINTRLLKKLLDIEHPNAPVSAERLQWGRRTGDWEGVPSAIREWTSSQDSRFSPLADTARRLPVSEDIEQIILSKTYEPEKYLKSFLPRNPLREDHLHASAGEALNPNIQYSVNKLLHDRPLKPEEAVGILGAENIPVPASWIRQSSDPANLQQARLFSFAHPDAQRDLRALPDDASPHDVVRTLERVMSPEEKAQDISFLVDSYLQDSGDVLSAFPAEALATLSDKLRVSESRTSSSALNPVLDTVHNAVRNPQRMPREDMAAIFAAAREAKLEADSARSRLRKYIMNTRATPVSPIDPDIQTLNYSTGEIFKSHSMFDPASRAYRAQSPYQVVEPKDPTWVTGHPDVARQYAEGTHNRASVFEFDPAKVPPKEQSPWHAHVARDSRYLSPEEIASSKMLDPTHVDTSPYYEKVVTEGALRPTLTKRWRPTKDGGLELMEDFSKSKGKKPEF